MRAHRGRLPARDQRQPVPADQLGCEVPGLSLHGMANCVEGVSIGPQPVGCASVEPRQRSGDQLSRLEAQHLPQQGRVAIPVAARVERIDQPVMCCELGERRPAAAGAGERIGELAVDLLDAGRCAAGTRASPAAGARAPRSPGTRSRRGRRRRSSPGKRPHPHLPSSESAASLTPAGQPSVRSSSSPSSRSSSSTPASAHSDASLVAGQGQVGGPNLRQAARPGAAAPSATADRRGSMRTRRSDGGACSARASRSATTSAEAASWKSSSTSTTGSAHASSVFISDVMKESSPA